MILMIQGTRIGEINDTNNNTPNNHNNNHTTHTMIKQDKKHTTSAKQKKKEKTINTKKRRRTIKNKEKHDNTSNTQANQNEMIINCHRSIEKIACAKACAHGTIHDGQDVPTAFFFVRRGNLRSARLCGQEQTGRGQEVPRGTSQGSLDL